MAITVFVNLHVYLNLQHVGCNSSQVTTNILCFESLLTFPSSPGLFQHICNLQFASVNMCNRWHAVTKFWFLLVVSVGSGTESDSDDSVPELEEQDSAQTQTQQAQVRVQAGLECCVRGWLELKQKMSLHLLLILNTLSRCCRSFSLLWWFTQWLSFFWAHWSQPFCPEKSV